MTDATSELILILLMVTGLCTHCLITLRFRARGRDQTSRFSLGETALLTLTGLTMIFVPVMDYFDSWFDYADYLFFDGSSWLGLVAGSMAILLYWQARMDRLNFYRSNELMRKGVYRFLRHPVYTAMLLWALAQLLLLQNWFGGPAAALTFVVVYLIRVPAEEDRQLHRFGHVYLDYMETTGGIFPRLFRHKPD